MRKISTLFKIVLGFVGGLLSGAFIHLGFEVLDDRPSSVGGEVLILPLIVLLLCLGFSLGKEFAARQNTIRTHDERYYKGRSDERALQRLNRNAPLYMDADSSTPGQ